MAEHPSPPNWKAGVLLVSLLAACRVEPPREASPAIDARAAGSFTKAISFAILEDYDKGDDLGEIARDFAAFRELGATVWRGSFGWDDYEPARGRFDFNWLKRFVALADSAGITLRPYLGYTPAWAGRRGTDDQAWNDPPGRLEDWSRFVTALATALADEPAIRSYEIYNEENVALWWDGTAEEYAAVLRRGAEAVRRADPDAGVLLGGLVWPDPEWLEATCVAGQGPFDVLPFHAYPETWTPPSVTVENYLGPAYDEHFLAVADQRCGKKPIWINETGFATTPGKSDRQQADWWARAFATFLSAPRVEHLGIYEIRDQQKDTPVIGDAPNYHLGLLREDRSPKLAFKTVKLLLRLFDADSITVADKELAARVIRGSAGKLYHHLFIRPDGKQLIFVWDRGSGPTLDLQLSRPGSVATAYQLDGRGAAWRDFDGRVIRGVKLVAGEVRVFEVEPAGQQGSAAAGQE
jgi:hypothetical protein